MDLGLIILAGGEGTRMKKSKPFLKLDTIPLILYVIAPLYDFVNQIIICTKRTHADQFRSLHNLPKIKIIYDLASAYSPLLGLATGLTESDYFQNIILPCDSPFINIEVIKYLIKKSHGMDIVIPQWPNGYIEPIHALYSKQFLVSLKKTRIDYSLDRKQLSIYHAIKNFAGKKLFVSTTVLEQFDPQLLTFYNINQYSDLKTAEKYLKNRNIDNSHIFKFIQSKKITHT